MSVSAAPAGNRTLEDRLGHRFTDPCVIELALTHRSWSAEHPESPSNERLEFLGDAVLGLMVTHKLYGRYETLAEGDLAKTRAALVSTAALADMGRSLGLGAHLRLGRGEDASGGREKASLLANAMEAVIGAVYLDGGIVAAGAVVEGLLGARIDAAARSPGHGDFKTRLQELAARLGSGHPVYEVTTSGPAHHRRFRAEVRIGAVAGAGEGHSKKEAEQGAAEAAYRDLASEKAEAAYGALLTEGGS